MPIEKETIGIIAQMIVASSIIPYVISIFRGTVKPNRVSWFIWSIVGFTFWLVTPDTADTITKMLTFTFMINPTIVFILTLFKGENTHPDRLEKFSLTIGLFAICVWYFARESAGILPIFIAIVADFCALIPTLRFVYTSPQEEAPLAWILFFVGFSLALFGVENYNLLNLALPSYMLFGSLFVAYPLVRYRLKMKIPLRHWLI
ncbi:MAG: hypothetical protein JXQ67_08100 [Campylobacterales bacterium]|nr:hypothetical protein [Campylobacterales bacterium]